IARKNTHQNNRCIGRLLPQDVQYRSYSGGDISDPRVFLALRGKAADVVGSREEDYYFWVDAIQLAIVQPPENVLSCIAAPAKIGGIPTKEVLSPVRQKRCVLVVACTPSPG